MKTIECWEDGEYRVKIKAQFETNGYDISPAVLVEEYIDCVRIEGAVSKGSDVKRFKYVASARTYYEKKSILSKKKYLTIHEAYTTSLEEARKDIQIYIKKQRELARIQLSDDEITDGLPDSLKGM